MRVRRHSGVLIFSNNAQVVQPPVSKSLATPSVATDFIVDKVDNEVRRE